MWLNAGEMGDDVLFSDTEDERFCQAKLPHRPDLRAALSSGMRFSFALESMLRMLNAKDLWDASSSQSGGTIDSTKAP